jgi:hypothetical protein
MEGLEDTVREPDDDEQPVTGEQGEPEERAEPPQDITMSGGATLPKLGAGNDE